MKSFTKNLIKNIVIILLLITNITTITTIVIHQQKHKFMPPAEGFKPPPPPPQQEGHFGKFIDNELNLSHEQKESFRNYRQKFREKTHAEFEKMRTYRETINQELQKPEPNKKVLEEAAEKIGNHHRNMKMNSFEMILKMKSECNEEQAQKLTELFISMQPKHHPPHHQRKKRRQFKK